MRLKKLASHIAVYTVLSAVSQQVANSVAYNFMCSRFAEETANPDKRVVSEKQITKYQYFAKFSKVHLKCTSLQVKVLF